MSLPLPSVATQEADVVRRVAREVLERDYYQLTTRRRPGRGLLELIVDFFEWLARPIRFIFEWLYAISPVFGWMFILLLALIAAALVAHIIYLLMRATETSVGNRSGARTAPPADPAQLEKLADDAVRRRDWISAARYLFGASLLRLGLADKHRVRASTTNRELLRQYRDTPLVDPLRVLVDVIERKWYGQDVCLEADFQSCRAAYGLVCRAVAGSRSDA